MVARIPAGAGKWGGKDTTGARRWGGKGTHWSWGSNDTH